RSARGVGDGRTVGGRLGGGQGHGRAGTVGGRGVSRGRGGVGGPGRGHGRVVAARLGGAGHDVLGAADLAENAAHLRAALGTSGGGAALADLLAQLADERGAFGRRHAGTVRQVADPAEVVEY